MEHAKTRKRKARSKHPGVKIKARTLPSGATSYRAVYKDPASGKDVYETLDASLTTAEQRQDWAKKKSLQLDKQRVRISLGEQPVETQPFEQLLTKYREDAVKRLGERTLETIDQVQASFRAWMAADKVSSPAQFGRPQLKALHSHILAEPRKQSKRGAKRGTQADVGKRRPATINRIMRTLITMLGTWRAAGLLPHVDSDAIRDNLKKEKEIKDPPEYLSPSQLLKLIEAARKHDVATYEMTRKEHDRERLQGTTRKYRPILPFLAFVLLTGCRRSEALQLEWDEIDLDALDSYGNKVGELRLWGDSTKTRHGRIVGLEVAPLLRTMLAEMKLRARATAVFGGGEPYTKELVDAAMERLRDEFGAPKRFTWQILRSTCSTFLMNAPGVPGGCNPHFEAKQLGHGVKVAQDYYAGLVRGIPRDAHTLEAAMQIEAALKAAISDSLDPGLRGQGGRALRARSAGGRRATAQPE